MPGTSPGKGLWEANFSAKRPHELPFNFPRTALRLAEGGRGERNLTVSARLGGARTRQGIGSLVFGMTGVAADPNPRHGVAGRCRVEPLP